jgi:hypothetical protein
MRKESEKTWLAYLAEDQRYAAMAGLGFSSGVPFLLVYPTQSAWLSEAGVPIETIGLLSELTIAYDAHSHADERKRRELLAEQAERHQRRHRRREVEQADDARRRRPADHEIIKPHRAERQHPNEIRKRRHKIRRFCDC